MARTLSGGAGQARQPGMSHSPWSGPPGFAQMQAAIPATAAWAQGGPLLREESAAEQAGPPNVGASRPDTGRRGQVDIGRGDTGRLSAPGGVWPRVDGELCRPEAWVGEEWAARRQALGLPQARPVETTRELGLKRGKRGKAQGRPFALLACDAFDGRDRQGRAALEAEPVP